MITKNVKSISPTAKITYFLFLLILWVISGWNTKNADLDNYILMYSNNFSLDIKENLDVGFMYILSIFNDIGYTFDQFHICIYLLYLAFIGWYIYRYSGKPIVGLTTYVFLFFFRDCITLRNSLAAAFFIAALIIYTNNEIKSRKIWFAILILIASSIHISFLVLFGLLFSSMKINYKWVFIGGLFFAFASHSILGAFISMDFFSDNSEFQNKYDDYMSSSSWFSTIVISATLLANYIVTKKTLELVEFNKNDINHLRLKHLLEISSILFVIIVFSSISMTVMRFYYNYFMFANIFLYNRLYCEGLPVNNKLKKIRLMYWGFVWWIFYWLVYMSNISLNIPIILQYNSFLT